LHHDDALDRLSAFSTFGRAHGLAMPDRWIVMGDYTYPGPEEDIRRMLMLSDRPTAVFSSNARSSMLVVHALPANELVPPKLVAPPLAAPPVDVEA
jgi:LacI family transcriptional regulator